LKATYYLIPAAALVAVIAWNVHLSRSVNTVERDTADVENSISRQKAESQASPPERTDAARERVPAATVVTGSIDWRSIAAALGKLEDRMDAAADEEISQLEERLEEMSAPN